MLNIYSERNCNIYSELIIPYFFNGILGDNNHDIKYLTNVITYDFYPTVLVLYARYKKYYIKDCYQAN